MTGIAANCLIIFKGIPPFILCSRGRAACYQTAPHRSGRTEYRIRLRRFNIETLYHLIEITTITASPLTTSVSPFIANTVRPFIRGFTTFLNQRSIASLIARVTATANPSGLSQAIECPASGTISILIFSLFKTSKSGSGSELLPNIKVLGVFNA